jgi:Cysteine rich repeat
MMLIRGMLMTAVILGVASTAFAQTSGTPELRAACGPDVRKFCHKIKEADGDNAYLQCLEANRDSLSARCSAILKSYGK